MLKSLSECKMFIFEFRLVEFDFRLSKTDLNVQCFSLSLHLVESKKENL